MMSESLTYPYNNVIELSSYSAMNLQIQKYCLHVNKHNWADLINQDDLRFYKSKKNILNILTNDRNGVMLKISTWNHPILKHDYFMSKKIKNINFVQHHCYFEYEEDIIKFLCAHEYDKDIEDINNDSAVILSPYYSSILHIPLNSSIVKQIILSLYTALFTYYIQFQKIDINNIYVEKTDKIVGIHYKLENPQYVNTNHVVKIDEFSNSEMLYKHEQHNFKQLYTNIVSILEQFKSNHLINVIEFVKDFNTTTNHVVHPMKILHGILFQIDSSL
jgi:hypothetical protein